MSPPERRNSGGLSSPKNSLEGPLQRISSSDLVSGEGITSDKGNNTFN